VLKISVVQTTFVALTKGLKSFCIHIEPLFVYKTVVTTVSGKQLIVSWLSHFLLGKKENLCLANEGDTFVDCARA
jgi:hypothetical protein